MKKIKLTIALLAAALTISAGAMTSMAASYQSPAEVVAGLTGKSVEEVVKERDKTGKSYGMMADEAGKLDEFKTQCLSIREDLLNDSVEKGTLSQKEADDILASIKAHQQVCDGSGYGYGHSASCGSGYGRGHGYGHRSGNGHRGGHCYY